MEIEDKVVAVTGAGTGIGAATARRLAAAGGRLVLAGRDTAALASVQRELQADGADAVQVGCDVTRIEDVRRLVDTAIDRFGRLDVLVANAGVATVAPLADGDPADWDAMIDVNLRGVLHGIAAALPVFTAQGSGHFVTVTSTSSIKWVPGQAVYAATKAGVRALCEVLRQEAGPSIRASIVCPGATATQFGSGGDPQTAARLATMQMDPSAVAEAIAYAIGQPAGVDVGEIVVRSAAQP